MIQESRGPTVVGNLREWIRFRNWRLKRVLSIAIAVGAALALGAYVWGWILQFSTAAFHYDEGLHAYHLTRTASQLAAGSIYGYLSAAVDQIVYPPGYSWLAAPLVLWLGAEPATLRGLSLFWFMLATLVAWRAAANLSRRQPGIAGVTATLLMLTSAPLIIFASNVLLESVGLLFIFLFLNAWSRIDKHSTRLQAIGAGLLAGACFLLKYPFGVFAGAALGIAAGVGLIRRRSLHLSRNERLVLGSAALIVALYLFLPGRLDDVLTYGTLQPATTSIWTLGNILYYGKSLVTQYAVSPLIGTLALVAVGLAIFLPQRKNLHRWALYFWVAYLILTLKAANESRFAAVVLPAAFVVTAALFADFVDILLSPWRSKTPVTLNWSGLHLQFSAQERTGRRFLVIVSSTFAVVLLLTTLFSLKRRVETFPALLALGYKTDALAAQNPFEYVSRSDNLNDLYQFVSDSIDDVSPNVLVLNTFNELNAPALGWRLAADRFGVATAEVQIWPHYAYENYPEDFASFRERLIVEDIEYVVILRDSRWGPVHAGPRGLAWHLRHDLAFVASDLFSPTILEDAATFERLLANYEFGPPELEGRFRGLAKEWPHVVDVLQFVPDGFVDSPLPNLYGLLDLPLDGRNYSVPEPQNSFGAEFGGKVDLVGYDLLMDEAKLELTFHWQGREWMNEDYHIFIHLLAPDSGELVFGHDFILSPEYPIQWWASGEVILETIMLDLSPVPSGIYRLGMGIYDFETGQRLPVSLANRDYSDGWLPLDEKFEID